jgi:hypothetical protein
MTSPARPDVRQSCAELMDAARDLLLQTLGEVEQKLIEAERDRDTYFQRMIALIAELERITERTAAAKEGGHP